MLDKRYYQVTHEKCQTCWSGTIQDLLTTECEICGLTFLEMSNERAEDIYGDKISKKH